jgi:hypothetical protein
LQNLKDDQTLRKALDVLRDAAIYRQALNPSAENGELLSTK